MKVLFICWGNSGRSQFAEGFFRKLVSQHEVMSAGTNANERNAFFGTDHLPQPVMQVMDEAGIDVSSQRRKQLTEQMVKDADLVVGIIDKKSLPEYVLKSPKFRHWDIADPKDKSLDIHRQARDEVRAAVEKLVAELG